MFLKTSKPTQTDRKNLGEQLDMSPRAVQVWFQNRSVLPSTHGLSLERLFSVHSSTDALSD